MGGYAEVTVAELADLLAADPTTPLIDVRSPEEFAQARVPGAELVPMHTVPIRLQDIPSDRRVYLICATGGRSAQTGAWLAERGYDVANVVGGTQAWYLSGRPIDS